MSDDMCICIYTQGYIYLQKDVYKEILQPSEVQVLAFLGAVLWPRGPEGADGPPRPLLAFSGLLEVGHRALFGGALCIYMNTYMYVCVCKKVIMCVYIFICIYVDVDLHVDLDVDL